MTAPIDTERRNKRSLTAVRGHLLIIAAAWTAVVGVSLFWNLRHRESEMLEQARIQARAAYEKDVVYRRWNAAKGGVYASASESTPPNPYLRLSDRDIQTPSGQRLTLVNPAYMTRQVHEMSSAAGGILGHITSLNPLRPGNAPDAWERSALDRFNHGETEVSSVESINGRPHMRLMRPLITEQGCLKCHEQQGYKVGDIRGGISVAVPLEAARSLSRQTTAAVAGSHIGFWIIGLVGLGIAGQRVGRRVRDHQRFEQTLAESESRHRSVFECATDAMLLFDTSGKIVDANSAASAIYGYDRDELIGRHGNDLVHVTSPCQFEQFRLKLQAGGKFHAEGVGMRKDGSPVMVELRGATLNSYGRAHLLAVIRDVTDQRRTEIRLTRITECFLAFGSDPTENIRSVTTLCSDMLGADFAAYSRLDDQMLQVVAAVNLPNGCEAEVQAEGRPCTDVIRGPGDQTVVIRNLAETRYADTLRDMISLGTNTYVGRAVRCGDRNGGVLCLLYRREFWPEPEDERILTLLASAISVEEERREGQERLQDSNDRLRDTLEREKRTSMTLEATLQQLAAATREARAATQAKSEFLAAMSHEIRTPMTSILGFAESLLDPDLSIEDHKTAIDTIRRNGQHLLELINDVLDLSKIEANMLEVEHTRIPLISFISELESLMRPRAISKGLQLSTQFAGPVPEFIESDPTRLRQVLINLIGNAIKFTDSGSIRMVIRMDDSPSWRDSRLDSRSMQFEVTDTGIGLSPDQMEKLFRPFSQGDASTTRQFGGTGLGLVISRRIAEKLGGTIQVHSTLGMGSTFVATVAVGSLDNVRLLEDASCAESALKAAVPTELSSEPLSCRILLAEDGPDNQRLISYILTKAGADVTVVENGKAAVDTALAASFHRRANDPKEPFDVVLMDMQMPVMDGYEASRRLRERGYAGPIIALTAHAMSGDRDKCLEAGCDDFLTKPIVRKNLIEAIRQHLSKAASRQKSASEEGGAVVKSQDPKDAAEKAVDDIREGVAAMESSLAHEDFAGLISVSGQVKHKAGVVGWRSVAILVDTLEHTLQCDRDIERLRRQIRALAVLCDSGPEVHAPAQPASEDGAST